MIPTNYTEAQLAEINGVIGTVQDDISTAVEYLSAKNAHNLANKLSDCVTDLSTVMFQITCIWQMIESGNKYMDELIEENNILKQLK